MFRFLELLWNCTLLFSYFFSRSQHFTTGDVCYLLALTERWLASHFGQTMLLFYQSHLNYWWTEVTVITDGFSHRRWWQQMLQFPIHWFYSAIRVVTKSWYVKVTCPHFLACYPVINYLNFILIFIQNCRFGMANTMLLCHKTFWIISPVSLLPKE